jgi:hypothetical protein
LDSIRRQREKVLGRKHTEEERAHIREGLKGRHAGGFHNKGKVRTEANKQKISATMIARYAAGIHKGRLGSKHSEETKRIIGLKSKGHPPNKGSFTKGVSRPMSDSCKRKISLSLTGRKLSEETKQKIRIKRHLQVIVHSHETRRKISEAQKGKPRPLSQSHLTAIRNANCGNPYRLGKSHTAATKDKISRSKIGSQQTVESNNKRSKSMTAVWAARM